MKRNPDEMTKAQIERELKNYEWEYIAIADLSRNDAQYWSLVAEADNRKSALLAALEKAGKP